ncbi:hypothetical protein OSTOST_19507, partial [Ostertagia ostertagi]
MRHAAKCKFEHSSNSESPGLGENIWATDAIKLDKAKAAEWRYVVRRIATAGVGFDNLLTKEVFYRPHAVIVETASVSPSTIWESRARTIPIADAPTANAAQLRRFVLLHKKFM